MSYLVTLDTFQLRVRERTDKLRGQFVTDDELRRYINAGIAALHELIVDSNEDYFLSQAGVTATAGDHEVALPATFWKLRTVLTAAAGATTGYVELIKSDISTTTPLIGVSGQPVYYTLSNILNVFPAPSSTSIAFLIVYIPAATQLVAGTETYDCVNGWDDFVVTYAAINVRDKEEVSTTVLQGQLAMIQARIVNAVKPRDQGQPRQVRRVRNDFRGGGIAWRRRYP